MLKETLKQDFGCYCDTDKLVDDVIALLTKYHYKCTEAGVCRMLHEYFFNKKKLIDLFMKSDCYIGDMRICLNVELERRNNADEIYAFCRRFAKNVEAKPLFIKYVDEYGKTLSDYMRTGIRKLKARTLYHSDIAERLVVNSEHKNNFLNDGSTVKSNDEFSKFCDIIRGFQYYTAPALSEEVVSYLQRYKMNATFTNGMKTSRAFNRVCACYGVDKLERYNKLFAQYADMVSGLKRNVCFYISLNPLDYLTMSFGNSWSSCHTIDKRNERGMPNSYQGMHAGGVMSYMLDETSIITFVHNHAMKDYEEGKVYRNMFHYHGGTLIQGRIYPQGNDGSTDLYKEFRRIVQKEFTKLLELDEDDWIRRTCDCDNNTSSRGVHYCDYLNFSECNVSYPREMPASADHVVKIGHTRICPNCGDYIDDCDDSGMLTHYDCRIDAVIDDLEF